eukprot:scaffold205509_cov55-Attheya_sp.AAC.1
MARWPSPSPSPSSPLWVVILLAAVTGTTESSPITILEDHPHRKTWSATHNISSRWMKPPPAVNATTHTNQNNASNNSSNNSSSNSSHNPPLAADNTQNATNIYNQTKNPPFDWSTHRHGPIQWKKAWKKNQFNWAIRRKNHTHTHDCPPIQPPKVDSEGNYGRTSLTMTSNTNSNSSTGVRKITIPYQYQLETSPQEEENLLLFEGERDALLHHLHQFIVDQGWLPFWFSSSSTTSNNRDHCHSHHRYRHRHSKFHSHSPSPIIRQYNQLPTYNDTVTDMTVVGIQTHPLLHQMNVTQECWYQSTISGNPCHVISGQLTLYLEPEDATNNANHTFGISKDDHDDQQQQEREERWTFPAWHRLDHVLQGYNAYQERFQQTTKMTTFYDVHLTLLDMPHCSTPYIINQTTLYDNDDNNLRRRQRKLRHPTQQQRQRQRQLKSVDERPILYGIRTVHEIPMKVHYQVETIHDTPPPSSSSTGSSSNNSQRQRPPQLQRLLVKFNRQLLALLVPLLFPQDCMAHHHKDNPNDANHDANVNSDRDVDGVMGLYYPMDHHGVIDGGTSTSCPGPVMFMAEECIIVEATFVIYVDRAMDGDDLHFLKSSSSFVAQALASSTSSSLFERLDDSIVRVTVLNHDDDHDAFPSSHHQEEEEEEEEQQQVPPT